MWVLKALTPNDSSDNNSSESWLSWKTVIFTGVLLFGVGYALRGVAQATEEVRETFEDSNSSSDEGDLGEADGKKSYV